MNVMHVLKTLIAFTFIASFVIGALFMIRSSNDEEMNDIQTRLIKQQIQASEREKEDKTTDDVQAGRVLPKFRERHPEIKEITAKTPEAHEIPSSDRPPSVHIFYYPWYGNPEFDHGKYYHWDHPLLLRTKPKKGYEQTRHKPPNDVASVYYPQLAAYSSRDPTVIDRHFKWIASSGVDVVAVSWYPKGKADDQGYPWEDLFPQLLNTSLTHKLKLAIHLEPYARISAESVRNDIEYIVKTYGSHPALYKTHQKNGNKELPLIYLYDSYRIPVENWQKIALPNGENTIRNTEIDAILIGLTLKVSDINDIKQSGFDGLYTYFAADGFTEASTMDNWARMSKLCNEQNLLFIPSIGPGYDDSRVRPWNGVNTRERNNGEYYIKHFEAAHASKPDIISITSFNEWHEGTQIEPSIPFEDTNTTQFKYLEYEKGPEMYLQLTNEMVRKYFVPHHENIPMDIAKIV